VNGGEEEDVLDAIRGRSWAVAQDGVYFLQMQTGSTGLYGTNQPAELLFYDFHTKRVRNTGFRTPHRLGNNGVTLTPDSKFLIYPQLDELGSDIMLVEHFR